MNPIDTINQLKRVGPYTPKLRVKQELDEIGGEFVKSIADKQGGFDKRVKEIYIGYESKPWELSEKLPNMTLFWNLPLANGYMYASSMGHLHPPADFDVQEVYEFKGYGGMLVSSEKRASFYLCEPNDKVPVPPNCIMTIFNLSPQRLLTLDMSNPLTNSSSKDIIKSRNGPMMAVYNQGNPSSKRNVCIELNPNYPVWGIDHPVTLELEVKENESGLYEALIGNKALEKYNLEVLTASPNWNCRGRNSKNYHLNRGLIEMVLSANKPIHHLLGMI